MDERTKASLLWGVAGGLAFLVLVQTARLLTDLSLGLPAVFPVAVLVAVVTALLGWVVEGGLAGKRQV
jgi:hypothetical protein